MKPLPVRTICDLLHRGAKAFVNDETGQDLIEYALVAALIGLGAVASMKGLSGKVSNSFNSIGTSLTENV